MYARVDLLPHLSHNHPKRSQLRNIKNHQTPHVMFHILLKKGPKMLTF